MSLSACPAAPKSPWAMNQDQSVPLAQLQDGSNLILTLWQIPCRW